MGAHGRTAYGRGSLHRGRRGRFPAIATQSALLGLQARCVMRALGPLLAMHTPQPAEERTQFRCALVFQNARDNRECMVQARVDTHVVERSERAALGIGRTVYAPVDARVDHETRTHETGLERDVDGAATQAPPSKRARRLHHGEELGVRRGVFVQLTSIVGPSDDRALVHHDRADRHLADLGGRTRLGERLAHEALVILARHRSSRHLIDWLHPVNSVPLAPRGQTPRTSHRVRCYHYPTRRRDGRAVECGGLENR